MRMIIIFIIAFSSIHGNGKSQEDGLIVPKSSLGIEGAIVSVSVDFDIYRVRSGDSKSSIYYYIIMPAPDVGIGGRELTYLGRMPAGTQLEIVSLKKGKWFQQMSYWVRPVLSIDNRLKGSSSRKAYVLEENLDDQVYKLSSIASSVGLYEKGEFYSNGAPKLNETWFALIKLNE